MATYIHRDNSQLGPYTDEQLRDLLASATIHSGDLAWREGLTEWQPLNLFFSPQPPAGMPPVPKPLDPKFASRLNTAYRTSRMMLVVCGLSIVMPFILMIVAPLGVLYFIWRKGILSEVDSKKLSLSDSQRKEVAYLRANKQELLLPLYFLVGFALFAVALIAFLPRP